MLASRCISCSRKSSFLPISDAPEASSDSNCCTWLRRRASSSDDVAALGGDGGFLREARGIDAGLRRAVPCRRASRRRAKAGRARFGERLDFCGELADVAQAAGHFVAQMRLPVRACDRACRALRRGSAPARIRGARVRLPCEAAAEPTTPGRRRMAARSGSRLECRIPCAGFDSFQIGSGDFVIYANRGRPGEFVVQGYVQMTAANAFADDLANARFRATRSLPGIRR